MRNKNKIRYMKSLEIKVELTEKMLEALNQQAINEGFENAQEMYEFRLSNDARYAMKEIAERKRYEGERTLAVAYQPTDFSHEIKSLAEAVSKLADKVAA
jgi:hypothetical protein